MRPVASTVATAALLFAPGCATLTQEEPHEEPPAASPPSPEKELKVPDEGPANQAPETVCAGTLTRSEATPALVHFVVDTSGSMSDVINEQGPAQTKWSIVHEAIDESLATLPQRTQVGLTLFPGTALTMTGPCFDEDRGLSPAPLGTHTSDHRAALRTLLDDAVLQGGTPTHDAYAHGLSELEALDEEGDRFVILLTDGTPTYALGCDGTGLIEDPVDPAELIFAAEDAYQKGIRTFVISAPGINEGGFLGEDPRIALSAMAEAGGTAPSSCDHLGPEFCHWDMNESDDFSAALADALAEVSQTLLSCDYPVPDPPEGEELNPWQVNVMLRHDDKARLVLHNDDSACDQGWRYTHSKQRIRLCEETCANAQQQEDASIQIELGCETQYAVK